VTARCRSDGTDGNQYRAIATPPERKVHLTGHETTTVSWKVTDQFRTERLPLLALGVAVLAGSTGAIFVRVTDAPSVIDAFYRLFFTTIVLLPVTLWNYRADLRAISKRDLAVALTTGVLLAVHFVTWMESLRWTSVAASSVLVNTQVVFVAIGSVLLLDESISRGKAAGIGLALAGVTVMTGGSVLLSGQAIYVGENPAYGNGLAVLGALLFAGYLLAGRSLRQRIHLFPYVTVVFSVSTVVLFVTAVVSPQPVSPTAYPPTELLLFVGMGLVPGILGHTVMNWSLKYVESNVVSVAFLGAPLGNALLAFVLLGESPGLAAIGGGVVVLTGIYQTANAR
jgi:drug/metabolite transporter (DMT)-like permease